VIGSLSSRSPKDSAHAAVLVGVGESVRWLLVGKMPGLRRDGSAWQMVAKYAFLIALLVFILVHLYINFGL
jgi:hypothetical protein